VSLLHESDYRVVDSIVRRVCSGLGQSINSLMAESLRDSLRDELVRLAQTAAIPEGPSRPGWLVLALTPRAWRYARRVAATTQIVDTSSRYSTGEQGLDVAAVYSAAGMVLSTQEHRAFMLRHPHGERMRSFAHVATAMQLPAKAVAWRLYVRAIDKLRSTLA
jgi:hypothetical protein